MMSKYKTVKQLGNESNIWEIIDYDNQHIFTVIGVQHCSHASAKQVDNIISNLNKTKPEITEIAIEFNEQTTSFLQQDIKRSSSSPSFKFLNNKTSTFDTNWTGLLSVQAFFISLIQGYKQLPEFDEMLTSFRFAHNLNIPIKGIDNFDFDVVGLNYITFFHFFIKIFWFLFIEKLFPSIRKELVPFSMNKEDISHISKITHPVSQFIIHLISWYYCWLRKFWIPEWMFPSFWIAKLKSLFSIVMGFKFLRINDADKLKQNQKLEKEKHKKEKKEEQWLPESIPLLEYSFFAESEEKKLPIQSLICSIGTRFYTLREIVINAYKLIDFIGNINDSNHLINCFRNGNFSIIDKLIDYRDVGMAYELWKSVSSSNRDSNSSIALSSSSLNPEFKRTVVVVGAGHVAGIVRWYGNIRSIEQKKKLQDYFLEKDDDNNKRENKRVWECSREASKETLKWIIQNIPLMYWLHILLFLWWTGVFRFIFRISDTCYLFGFAILFATTLPKLVEFLLKKLFNNFLISLECFIKYVQNEAKELFDYKEVLYKHNKVIAFTPPFYPNQNKICYCTECNKLQKVIDSWNNLIKISKSENIIENLETDIKKT